MSRTTEYRDELIYRKIMTSRYSEGIVSYSLAYIKKLNETIKNYLLYVDRIETKKQYQDCKVFIKNNCFNYRQKYYVYFQKELRGFIREQCRFVYDNSPVKLQHKDQKKILSDVNFEAFNNSDTNKSYITRIFNQIFNIWNSQLTIAYRIKQPMKELISLVLGE
jgi:hypothetical protein